MENIITFLKHWLPKICNEALDEIIRVQEDYPEVVEVLMKEKAKRRRKKMIVVIGCVGISAHLSNIIPTEISLIELPRQLSYEDLLCLKEHFDELPVLPVDPVKESFDKLKYASIQLNPNMLGFKDEILFNEKSGVNPAKRQYRKRRR